MLKDTLQTILNNLNANRAQIVGQLQQMEVQKAHGEEQVRQFDSMIAALQTGLVDDDFLSKVAVRIATNANPPTPAENVHPLDVAANGTTEDAVVAAPPVAAAG